MTKTSARNPVIVGVGMSDYPIAPHLTSTQHHAQAMQRALEDAGLPKAEIDGYCCAGSNGWGTADTAPFMAEYLGIDYRYLNGTFTGGSSFELYLQHAAGAIRSGLCDTVLITYGSDQFSSAGNSLARPKDDLIQGAVQLEESHGLPLIGSYAMIAHRHMHEFGTTPAQLAEVAVAAREFAGMNPLARKRDPLTIDDVLNSRMIADPLHTLDCCLVTDGGGAVLMTTAERARDLRASPVSVLGSGFAQSHWTINQMPDFTTSGATKAARDAFALAGVAPRDIDVAQLYDSFTITVLMLLEGLGFCGRGEGGAFAESGALRPGGRLPVNTDGGGLSSSHPGMRGIFLIIEAVRQLRGTAGASQVPDAALAVAAGSGGYLSGIGVSVLGAGL